MLVSRLIALLSLALLLTGCITKQSVVSSSNNFNPVSSQEFHMNKYRAGLVMRKSMDAEVARFVVTEGGLTYDFEFKIGQDIQRTLPIYLNSIVETVPIRSIDDGRAFDFILDPSITSSLFVHIGASAAPRYELSITLDASVIKEGAIINRFISRKNSRVVISAFENMDKERTETMRKKYEEQLTALYDELGVNLKELKLK